MNPVQFWFALSKVQAELQKLDLLTGQDTAQRSADLNGQSAEVSPGGFHSHKGSPIAGFIRENPNIKLMIWGYHLSTATIVTTVLRKLNNSNKSSYQKEKRDPDTCLMSLWQGERQKMSATIRGKAGVKLCLCFPLVRSEVTSTVEGQPVED